MAVAAVIAILGHFRFGDGSNQAMAPGRTLATCLILAFLQHSQNREMRALQTKVDELIRSSGARNHMIGVERLERKEGAPVVGR